MSHSNLHATCIPKSWDRETVERTEEWANRIFETDWGESVEGAEQTLRIAQESAQKMDQIRQRLDDKAHALLYAVGAIVAAIVTLLGTLTKLAPFSIPSVSIFAVAAWYCIEVTKPRTWPVMKSSSIYLNALLSSPDELKASTILIWQAADCYRYTIEANEAIDGLCHQLGWAERLTAFAIAALTLIPIGAIFT